MFHGQSTGCQESYASVQGLFRQVPPPGWRVPLSVMQGEEAHRCFSSQETWVLFHRWHERHCLTWEQWIWSEVTVGKSPLPLRPWKLRIGSF